MRPAGRPAGLAILSALAAAFFLLARSTGSGWVVVLLALCGGVTAVGVAAPALVLSRCRVTVRGPRDATAGVAAPYELHVPSRGLLRVRLVDPAGEWVGVDAPAEGVVLAVPPRRGVHRQAVVDVVCSSPLGLLAWRRRITVDLPVPVEAGPQPLAVSLADAVRSGALGAELSPRGRVGHENVRSVREYVPGDPNRLVHWPSTARWGELMVKELENPDAPHVTLLVDLRGDPARAEEAASRAAGLARAALAAGLRVTMLTAERDGPEAGLVATDAAAGRRLARAVASAPPEGPVPAGAVVVRVGGR